MKIRTRFSPSPTGMIHLGNVRTALFSALYAKANQGVFILRIEDTDATRSHAHYVDSLQDDLRWLGLDWQEGPGVEGAYGPYWQSQRQAIYAQYYQILENEKLSYPCFCTDRALTIARKTQLSRGLPPRYAGTCRSLSAKEIAQRITQGQKPTWRFKVAMNGTIQFVDIVKGLQCFQSDDIGDFIIRRADGTAPFLFCNAIDDALMKISHVLRGEDHLTNTPRQLMLLQALHLPVPQYGHLSLIVGDDGAPLSKRHGSFGLRDMRAQGFLPLAIINYLGRLGHASEIQGLLDFSRLAKHFYLEKLGCSPARFDQSQLLYWQKMAVQALDLPALWCWLEDQVADQVPESMRLLFAKTIQKNIVFPKDALYWAHIFFDEQIPMEAAEKRIICEAGEPFFVETERAVDQYGVNLEKVLADMRQRLGLSGKALFMPLRVALTGHTSGPELVHIAELLGPQKLKYRLSTAFKRANEG